MSLCCRWWNRQWKWSSSLACPCRPSCLLPCSSSKPSRSLTIQLCVVVVLEEVFLVFCNVLWSRSLTLPFLVVLVLVVFKVFTPDSVQCSALWYRPLTFQFLVVVVIKIFSRNRFQRRFLELNMSMEVQFPVKVLEGSRARRGAHVRVGGPQDSVPGQSSTAHVRADHRPSAGRLFIPPGPRGCGFIESSAEAKFGRAARVRFPVPVSWQGHFPDDASATFLVLVGLDGFMEACDIEMAGSGQGDEPLVSGSPLSKNWTNPSLLEHC